jgi:HK97 family phage major capsid protein
MAGYTEKLTRSTSNELPDEVSREVIQAVVEESAILRLAQRRLMPSHTVTMPVLDSFPEAYWLNGATRTAEDTDHKETTDQDWTNVSLTAAEIAVLIPIPDALVQDQLFDLLGEIKPRLAESFGKAIDQAAFWGDNKPTLWNGWGGAGVGIFDQITSAGNTVHPGTTVEGDTSPDLAAQVGEAARLLALDGFDTNGFAVQPGLKWRLRNMRDSQGGLVYQDSLVPGQPSTLFGEQLYDVRNGSWDSNRAVVILGDWNKAMVGIRQDMTISIHSEGTIYDPSNGQVKYSAVQQDGKILRAVMRVAFAVANPLTRLNTNGSTRYPFAAVVPTGAPSS